MFKVGDKVSWGSQAGGRFLSKFGTVVGIVPANVDVTNCLIDYCDGYKFMVGYGKPRAYESYLVAVGKDSSKRQIRLYWPKVKDLNKYEQKGSKSSKKNV